MTVYSEIKVCTFKPWVFSPTYILHMKNIASKVEISQKNSQQKQLSHNYFLISWRQNLDNHCIH